MTIRSGFDLDQGRTSMAGVISPHQQGRPDMPTESIIALVAIMAMFGFFSAVLGWASHKAPSTFPEGSERRSEPMQAGHGRLATAGAH
jgi:hypothetical protein